MYKVKVIDKKNIRWLNNGDTLEMCNSRAESFASQGVVKILKYTGNGKMRIASYDKQIADAKQKILMWQNKLKEFERLRKVAIKLNQEIK